MTPKDDLDEEVERLMQLDGVQFICAVETSWRRATPLFAFCNQSQKPSKKLSDKCGCLTMVVDGGYEAATPELTAAIRSDKRIPAYRDDITKELLPILADWQRWMREYFASGMTVKPWIGKIPGVTP
jgi:hypothetical protein